MRRESHEALKDGLEMVRATLPTALLVGGGALYERTEGKSYERIDEVALGRRLLEVKRTVEAMLSVVDGDPPRSGKDEAPE